MKKELLLTLSSAAIVVMSASAQIAVTDSFFVTSESGGGSDSNPNTINRISGDFSGTVASSWSLNGGNAIAVYFGAEGFSGTVSATFGGQTINMVQSGVIATRNHVSAVGYLINPSASSGDIVLTANDDDGANNRLSIAFGVLSLSNVDSVAGSDTAVAAGDLSYTIGSNGGFVLGNGVNNSFDGGFLPTISGNPSTTLFSGAFDGNGSATFAYGTAASGSHDDTYGGVSTVLATSTLAFNAVPEPSSFALIAGFLGLTWIMVRRRS